MFYNEFNVIYLRVVQGCNLNCTHCFTLGNKDPYKTTDLSIISQFLDVIKDNVDPQKAVFYIHGGETFLAPLNYLRKVNDIIKSKFNNIKHDIIPQTNLIYKVDKVFTDFIKEEYNGVIGVSYDIDIRFDNDRQEALFFKNLKFLLQNDIKVNIAITAQKYLLKVDPIELVKKFDGVDSIDFELLTIFDDKTKDLKPNNVEWSDWLLILVKYYKSNNVSWCLPQIDLFIKSIIERKIYDCKCNCCDRRTFTLNPNGTMGTCPDKTYIEPISYVSDNFKEFADKTTNLIVSKLDLHELCQTCEHFEICGGNCELELFDDTEECPLSRQVLTYIKNNVEDFKDIYINRALPKIIELRTDYDIL